MRLMERSQKCKAISIPRKMLRHVIAFIFVLEQKKQQTLVPLSYWKTGELQQKFTAVQNGHKP